VEVEDLLVIIIMCILCVLIGRPTQETYHMVGIKCHLIMHVRNLGYLFLYKSGAKTRFMTISQL